MYVGQRKAMMDVLGSDEDALEAALGLGELAGLTVTNEADAYDVSSSSSTDNWIAPWKNRTSRSISFFCPSLNRVLFPMFCLLVEGEFRF